MRLALAVFLLLHGLAHGIVSVILWGFGVGSEHEVSRRARRILGGRLSLRVTASRGLAVVWLVLALGFVAVSLGVWRQSSWSLVALLAVCSLSLPMALVWRPLTRLGAAVDLALLAGVVFAGIVAFRADMRRAIERVSHSTMLETSAGAIEYATLGEGIPVLALHGTAGGWDQSLASASGLAAFGYRVIAPSRFGYLRTPLHPDASPALEADLWATFLDSLRIDRVAVLSWSAGAAVATQIALRHPDRVSKLVFFVPGGGGIVRSESAPPIWLVDALFKFNAPIWAAQQLAPRTMLKWVAVPDSLVPSLAPADSAELRVAIELLFPVSMRHDGMLYDARSQAGEFGLFPIDRITVPTLWISAADDLYGTLRVAEHAARTIPGARLLAYESGGHLLLGRGGDYWPRVDRFLRES